VSPWGYFWPNWLPDTSFILTRVQPFGQQVFTCQKVQIKV